MTEKELRRLYSMIRALSKVLPDSTAEEILDIILALLKASK
jgi:hypothetical protein